MNISFKELREIKHQMPSGSVNKIATQLGISEQTVRNYFGANKFEEGAITGKHIQPGPNGGVVNIEDTTILEIAKQIIHDAKLGI